MQDANLHAPGADLAETGAQTHARWPARGWVGLALVTAFWAVNWGLPGLRTHWAFFPLWLGFCLTIDALVYRRKGSSLLVRNARAYAWLFAISAPAWWLFEILNWRSQNWRYEGAQYFPGWLFVVLATLSFSTVMPAVFGAAELASTAAWLQRLADRIRWPRVAPTRGTLIGFFVAGWLALALLLAWPRYFFGLLWVALYLIIEPINVWLGGRTILSYTARRDWRPVLALWAGVWLCAFFWEFWNFFSYPKWVYSVPFVGFLHVFEMPLLGYLGYLPFSLELFALYHLVERLLWRRRAAPYVQITAD